MLTATLSELAVARAAKSQTKNLEFRCFLTELA